MKATRVIPILLLTFILVMVHCTDDKPKTPPLEVNEFTPVDFPSNLGIPGFNFPEDSININRWIGDPSTYPDTAAIAAHGWGIWTGLNSPSGEFYNGQELRVFETWLTPYDMKEIIKQKEKNDSFQVVNHIRNIGNIEPPHQLTFHSGEDGDVSRVIGFVKYDPNAANFAIEKELFRKTTLNRMLKEEKLTQIPHFPNKAITLKPVFLVLNDSVPSVNGKYQVPVWPGTPENWPDTASYGSNLWNNNKYVDISGGSVSGDTVSVSSFINFKLDSLQAAQWNEQNKGAGAKPGDYAILQGMHVGTREITRWTWQTFWWSESPDAPYHPSSQAIADQRPDKLRAMPAASHYAMATAYHMVTPAQPLYGGESVGNSHYAFNPHLEAGFNNGVLANFNTNPHTLNTAIVMTNGTAIRNDNGIRTNCMSCHLRAGYAPDDFQIDYLGNAYEPLNIPTVFKDRLQVDFAWSIVGNLIE